jgi:hypothetical protein
MRSGHALLPLILCAISTAAFAESEARTSFDKMKDLAGEWEGSITTIPAQPEVADKSVHITIRITSRGNAVLHEMHLDGIPDDPITMFYMDSDRLVLTHYCDAGNRPRMVGKVSADGKTLEFELADLSGSTEKGHMHNATFSIVDSQRHTEEWTYMAPDGKTHILARFDLRRKK